ncbi:MAG: nucleotidyltransferase family protein [Gemmatimonadales bacterium]
MNRLTMSRPAPYAVLLAAGAGSRFGSDKLLARWQGTPIITHVATTIAGSVQAGVLAGAVAVIPPASTTIAWPLDTAGFTLVENPHARRGMSTSLQRGLWALTRPHVVPEADAALIVLADQPLLRREVIQALVADWREHGRSVRPRYAAAPGEPGHPVLLARPDWPLAQEALGDAGVGALLASVPDRLRVVEVAGANPDIDTPEDLAHLHGRH